MPPDFRLSGVSDTVCSNSGRFLTTILHHSLLNSLSSLFSPNNADTGIKMLPCCRIAHPGFRTNGTQHHPAALISSRRHSHVQVATQLASSTNGHDSQSSASAVLEASSSVASQPEDKWIARTLSQFRSIEVPSRCVTGHSYPNLPSCHHDASHHLEMTSERLLKRAPCWRESPRSHLAGVHFVTVPIQSSVHRHGIAPTAQQACMSRVQACTIHSSNMASHSDQNKPTQATEMSRRTGR